MHRDIPEWLIFFVRHFSTLRCHFFDYYSHYMFNNCQEEMVFITFYVYVFSALLLF